MKATRESLLVTSWLALAVGFPGVVFAGEPRVRWREGGCLAVTMPPGELERALRVELAGHELVSSDAATTPSELPEGAGGSDEVELGLDASSCDADETTYRVEIAFRTPTGRASVLSSEIELHDVPAEGRARTLAVAAAELLRVSARPLEERAPPPEREAPRPLQRPTPSASPRETLPAGDFVVELGASVFGGTSALPALLGGSWALRWRGLPVVDLRAGVGLDVAAGRVTLGELHVTRLSPSASLEVRVLEHPRLTLGPSFALPIVLARATSPVAEEPTLSDWVVTGGGRCSVSAPLMGDFDGFVAIEIGAYLRGLRLMAGGREQAVLAGPQGGVIVGLGWRN